VDNTQNEDWRGVELSLVSGASNSFIYDLYNPRYAARTEAPPPPQTNTASRSLVSGGVSRPTTTDRSRWSRRRPWRRPRSKTPSPSTTCLPSLRPLQPKMRVRVIALDCQLLCVVCVCVCGELFSQSRPHLGKPMPIMRAKAEKEKCKKKMKSAARTHSLPPISPCGHRPR
jgi:hypothetical protein